MSQKTRQEIEIDFTRAIDQAAELERLAVDLSRIANSGVDPAMIVIKNSWTGSASQSMPYDTRRAMADIYNAADDLLRVAKNIRTTADIVYKAEKKALKLCF